MTPSDSNRTERSRCVVGKFLVPLAFHYLRLAIVRKKSCRQALRHRKTGVIVVIVLYILSGLGGELSLSYRHKYCTVIRKKSLAGI